MKQALFPGDELRQRREELGLSSADVYRRTRIPISYIDAMEQGDVAELPTMCYALGFIRTYCRFLGLDSERYCDCLRACTQPPPGRFLRRNASSTTGWSAPAWFNEAVMWFAVCFVIAVTWFAYAVLVRPNADAEKRVDAETVEMVVPPPPADADY